jgi:hypothetical protein
MKGEYMKFNSYPAEGFHLISKVSKSGLKKRGLAAAANINKGDALVDNGSGYAADAGADLAATFIGIAAETINNASGAAGAKDIMFYPPFPQNQFKVPCDTLLIAQTDIGELIDLGADSSHVDPSDNVTTGWAFVVDDIDISAEALAADAEGYAMGHFEQVNAQT